VNIVEKIDDRVPVRNVLISLSDKQGLEGLVREILGLLPGLTIFSTGGTFTRLEEILGNQGTEVLVPVSRYTGQPETQGGLVKTLDFKIYLGLLTETYNAYHQEDLKRTGAVPIDLVMVNLYPFQKTIEKGEVTVEEARANIDIGGPCMVRAAAKNFHRVAVLVDPVDYAGFLKGLKDNQGCTRLNDRYRLAVKAFQHTAAYDQQISSYLGKINFAQAAGCYQIQK
jgi:phosphoribosylaminoimidazolecarboxamide formyltransferase/IMP cyclohydrolase